MKTYLNTPPKCWLEVSEKVSNWLESYSQDIVGGVEKEKVNKWVSRDHCPPNIVKGFRKVLRAIDKIDKKSWQDEVEAFEYWTAGPVGIAQWEVYDDHKVYGVSDEVVAQVERGRSTKQLDYDDPARWS